MLMCRTSCCYPVAICSFQRILWRLKVCWRCCVFADFWGIVGKHISFGVFSVTSREGMLLWPFDHILTVCTFLWFGLSVPLHSHCFSLRYSCCKFLGGEIFPCFQRIHICIAQIFHGLALQTSWFVCFQVIGIILRGIFLLRKKEINWFYQDGASAIYADGRNGPFHLIFQSCGFVLPGCLHRLDVISTWIVAVRASQSSLKCKNINFLITWDERVACKGARSLGAISRPYPSRRAWRLCSSL
jgi:hypothetical protein